MQRANQLQDIERYVEAINLYTEVIKRDVYLRFEAYVAIASCLCRLGRYRDALTMCDYAQRVYDGTSRQQAVWTIYYLDYLRNFATQKLRGRSPAKHSIYNPQDEYAYQQGGGGDQSGRIYEEGYWSQKATNVMDDTTGINSW